MGSLDGKGYSIIGLKKTGAVTERDNRYYFGFFGKIGKGGGVKNLNFTDVNVDLTKASGNASNRIFFGTVAGIVCGEVNNVSVVSGTYSFNHCVKGSSFVGGIAGFGREATFTDCKMALRFSAADIPHIPAGSALMREVARSTIAKMKAR